MSTGRKWTTSGNFHRSRPVKRYSRTGARRRGLQWLRDRDRMRGATLDEHGDECNDKGAGETRKEQHIRSHDLRRRREGFPGIRETRFIPHHLCLVDHDVERRSGGVCLEPTEGSIGRRKGKQQITRPGGVLSTSIVSLCFEDHARIRVVYQLVP